MGASPLISLIRNSKVIIVVSVPLLLLSPLGNYLDYCSGKYPPKYYSGECFVDRDSCDNCLDSFGDCCFTALPESGYWKVKECSSDFGP